MINVSLGQFVAAAAVATIAMSRGEAALIRRDCVFAASAEPGDTCKTMAEDWSITESQFISYNPGANCAKLTAGQEYCVEWTGKLPSPGTTTTSTTTTKPTTSTTPPPTTTTTRSTTSTTTSTTPSGPSPTQDGIVKNCERLPCFPVLLWTCTANLLPQANNTILLSREIHAVSSSPNTDLCLLTICKFNHLPITSLQVSRLTRKSLSYKWNPAVGTSELNRANT